MAGSRTLGNWCGRVLVAVALGCGSIVGGGIAAGAQTDPSAKRECQYVPLATVQQQFGTNISSGQADTTHCTFGIPNPSGAGLPMELSLNVNELSAGNVAIIKKGCTPKLTAATYNAKVEIATLVKGVGSVACYTAFTTKDQSNSEYDFNLAKKTGSRAIVATFAVRGAPADLKKLATAKQAQAKLTALAKAVASHI
jgi:hypothetical protein